MKKSIRRAIAMAMAMVMALTAVAQADTIISPSFRFPGVMERPTENPTVEPTAEPTPEPTVEPTAVPTAEPVVTEAPTETPVEEPAFVAPELNLYITSNLNADSIIVAGTEMILTLVVEGAEGYEYTIQWQVTEDGITWTDLPGETGHDLSIILAPQHTGMSWRANVEVIAPAK